MVNILAFCVFTLSFVGSSYTTNVVAISRDCGGYMFVGDSVVIDGPLKKNCILKFKTQEDRILVFSLIDGNFKEAEQYFSIHDGIDGDSPILLVENQKLSEVSRKDLPASVYSTQSTASIRFKKTASANFKLKIQKAVNCPFNLGSASQCGRVVDQVSCYCATFIKRNQSDQTMFCVDNGMKLIAFESQAEEGLIQST
uniref:CUB domain-containing protein n=1 Tax=Daphnia galeata TaxID=27404 RepID=A0A8J2WNJ2_9CRUS|nr:unnamed protein product [Daphnia galeata]